MNKENINHCKRIAEDIENIYNGLVFRCPECGEWITDGGADYNELHDVITCKCCGAEFNSDDAENVSLYDYFDDVYNVEYRANGRGIEDYSSVRVMVACGGPNIFIDTKTALVQLYWWTDYAEYSLDKDASDAIDDIFNELWACQ